MNTFQIHLAMVLAVLTFCCAQNNDLFQLLPDAPRYDTPVEAVERAAEGSGLLVLADEYPAKRSTLDAPFYARAKAKNLRLYVEYPALAPGIELGEARQAVWERAVIASDFFGERLPRLRILSPHGCTFLPTPADRAHVTLARVAGFDRAVFGLPKENFPLLIEANDGKWLIATTKLSNFVTARYAPTRDWVHLWTTILASLDHDNAAPPLAVSLLVVPRFEAADPLPRDIERQSFDAAAKWIHHSRLLLHESRRPLIHKRLTEGTEIVEAPAPHDPVGDGSLGILEGYASQIRPDGSQLQRAVLRSDCNAESAMVLAFDAALNKNETSRKVANNLLDFCFGPTMQTRGRADPKHPAFGLIAWGAVSPAWTVANYGDDDARVILSTILAAACLDSPKWDEHVMRSLLANLRTTGKLGFRTDRIDIPQLEARGWKSYHDDSPINPAPHFESYLWACYLWAYARTAEPEFLDKARTGIARTMQGYPDGWRWRDNIERARMLLCLAWLVRVDDTPEHRAWLDRVASDLLKYQDKSGAIGERLASTGTGFNVAQSNDAYGTGETPLLQTDGDPVCDQLYTTGFALLGLHEAVAATGDAKIKQAEDKLAEFLCRIQIKSEKLPQFAGTWFRAFDFSRWDFFASSGDVGWGAWSIEAGWGQAWIAATLGLREKGTTLWDITATSRIKATLEKVRADMAANDGSPWPSR